MITRAQDFFKWLDENKFKVIIPVPIITELLAPIGADKHEDFLRTLHSKFRVVPVDEIAAVKCAEIWQARKDDEELKQYREANKIARETMNISFKLPLVLLLEVQNVSIVMIHICNDLSAI